MKSIIQTHRTFVVNRSLSIFLFSAIAAVSTLRAADDANVIARVGDAEVKVDDIRVQLETLSASDQAALARDPSALGQVVRTLLVRRLVLKEARDSKWDQKPEVVSQIERARDNAVTESYLLSVSTPTGDFPSDAELQAAYDANKAALVVPKQYRVAQIFVSAPKGAAKATVDNAQTKLDTIRKNLKQRDTDFADIAKKESDDKESGARGGEIGWITESRLQPEIRSQIAGVPINVLSEPIRLDDGWHIVKVLEVKEAYTPALDEIRAPLVQQLRQERAKANSQAYLAKLLQQNPVAINELALSKILKKTDK